MTPDCNIDDSYLCPEKATILTRSKQGNEVHEHCGNQHCGLLTKALMQGLGTSWATLGNKES